MTTDAPPPIGVASTSTSIPAPVSVPVDQLDTLDLATLSEFNFDRVLSESLTTGAIYLLGTIRDQPAILLVQRPSVPREQASELVRAGLERLDVFLENRPYFSAHAKLGPNVNLADLRITITWPASDLHIAKYEEQERIMISETPEMFDKVVVPYIESLPVERVQWVYNILSGEKEAERVLYKDDHPENGFLLLPDLKWDQVSMNAMYLTVITQTRSIRCLRDLTTAHLPLLRDIRKQVHRTVRERYGVKGESVRMFVHYHPSYYHFHVHVVHIAHEGLAGMFVGQAHLLEDVISLLELSPSPPERSILARMNITFALGKRHPLCAPLVEFAKRGLEGGVEGGAGV